jgi:uncharacterized protein GlcG (DUF336 family)
MPHTPDRAQYGSISMTRAEAGRRWHRLARPGCSRTRSPSADWACCGSGWIIRCPVGGDHIGAFGVSGMQSVQDAQIAQARADELLEHDA